MPSARSQPTPDAAPAKARVVARWGAILRRRGWSIAVASVFAAVVWWAGPRLTPLPPALTSPASASGWITDRSGQPLFHALEPRSGARLGQALAPADVPPMLAAALQAAEDKRFARHDGFDPVAAVRAGGQCVWHRRAVSGASTLTMQLVKMRLHRDEPRTLGRKIKELWLARALETRWTKDRILASWLEAADFGNLQRGAGQAAGAYFRKPLADLSLAECATLVALPQSPARLNPYLRPERVLARRDRILERMGVLGLAPADSLARARAEPLRLMDPAGAFHAPHLVAMVRALPVAAGGPVHTTIDTALQSFAEERLRHHVARLAGHQVSQGAVVVIENRTGSVRALVGSCDFSAAAGQVNHALAMRSPGSALKPFTYLLAFEAGAGPWTVLADVPSAFPTPTGPYEPRNFHGHYDGPVTARRALANSLNLPAVRLLAAHGGPPALHHFLRAAGITGLDPDPARYGLGLTLGNAEVRLLDLAAAYATLAREGKTLPVRILEDGPVPAAAPCFDPVAVWLVTDILRDNQARAGSFSLESPLRFPYPVAAKTGTSTDYRDNWTLGFTPEHTVAVWVGNSDNRAMTGVSGVEGAAPVFHDLVAHLCEQAPPRWPDPPPGVVEVIIDPLTGKRVAAGHPRAVRDWANAAALPPAASAADTTRDGRVVLGAEYTRWSRSPENRWPQRFALRDDSPAAAPFRITFPSPGSEIVLDPALPEGGRRLICETDAADPSLLEWTSPTLRLERRNGQPQTLLVPGRHEIHATRPADGARRSTWIVVRER